MIKPTPETPRPLLSLTPPEIPPAPALRVTPEMLDDEIAAEHYHHFPGTTVVVCLLVLHNGSTVTGESYCRHFTGRKAEIGRDIAKGKARQAIYPLLNFKVRERLHLEECKRRDQVRRLREGERGAVDPLIAAVINEASA